MIRVVDRPNMIPSTFPSFTDPMIVTKPESMTRSMADREHIGFEDCLPQKLLSKLFF